MPKAESQRGRGAALLRSTRLLLLGPLLLTGILAHGSPGAPLAPGYGALGYEPPAPGEYALPVIGRAADGEVLDAQGRPRRLRALYRDRIVLLGFVYTQCSDINGCPLTAHVFQRLKTEMRNDRILADNLRLISFSFDPERDTPQAMHRYGENFNHAGQSGEWLFLTTASQPRLLPILCAYGQPVRRERTARGEASNTFNHLLRVFLIDRQQRIRNIYSASLLHPDLIIDDLRTLLAEEENAATPLQQAQDPAPPAGDGLEDVTAHPRHAARHAPPDTAAAGLLAGVTPPPLGLPPLPVDMENPLTAERIALGRKLFYDRRLSLNGTLSCAMCHVPDQGFTSNEQTTAVGIEGRQARRNAPSIYNVAYATRLFHDSRETTLENQIWGPLLAHSEMGNPAIGFLLEKIRLLDDYQGLFVGAFGKRGLTMETLGMAIAAYERTLVSGNAPFDRWYYGGESQALSAAAQRGFALFTTKAGCVACHTVGPDHALFTDNRLHNTGLGYREAMEPTPARTERVALTPNLTVDLDRSLVASVSGAPPAADLGRYEITMNPADRWKYRTPSLRNVALTAPYMHNGQLRTLEEVVRFFAAGGVENANLDPRMRPLDLSADEIRDLVAFLQALTGDNVERLVADAYAAPVGDIGPDDPGGIHYAATDAECAQGAVKDLARAESPR